MGRFETLESFAQWLNENKENIEDGYIRWDEIRTSIVLSGWIFNDNDYWIAYDNDTNKGVRYATDSNGNETAIVE